MLVNVASRQGSHDRYDNRVNICKSEPNEVLGLALRVPAFIVECQIDDHGKTVDVNNNLQDEQRVFALADFLKVIVVLRAERHSEEHCCLKVVACKLPLEGHPECFHKGNKTALAWREILYQVFLAVAANHNYQDSEMDRRVY